MSVLQHLLPVLVILPIVALAILGNRVLGLRLDDPTRAAPETELSEQERAWLEELAVLRLAERHPVC